MDKYEEQTIELPLGYMLANCRDWDDLCSDIGLNPWVLNEGRAMSEDTHPITIAMAKKHGLMN